MLRYGCRARAFRCDLDEFDVASALAGDAEPGSLQFALDFAVRQRFHAAMSTSTVRTCGAMVATGGVK